MKICIDAGHGAGDKGAFFKGVAEKDIVLLTALCLEKILQSKGYETVLTRDLDYYIPLSTRCDIANDARADIFISLHCNADPDTDGDGDPVAKGEEIWICRGSARGRRLAELLKAPVDAIFKGHKFRGIKEGSMYVTKHTYMPAVLVELGFMDSTVEVGQLSKPETYMRIASLLAEGVESYYDENS